MALSRSFIDEVRRSVDPVHVIGEVVALKKRGARFVGLCPFHQEKTPSFTVNDEGLWYCFGCGEGGDIFEFVQRHEAVDFMEAVRSLAERAGLEMPQPSNRGGGREGPRVERGRLREIVALADRFYRANLESDAGALARDFLARRGFEEALVESFGLGFALDSWDSLRDHLREREVGEHEAEVAGLLKPRDGSSGSYDRLRRRVVFPIRDLRGRTVAFGGRVVDRGEPKYLNSPETPLFQKSRILYGLGQARQTIDARGFALLVEGYFDTLACAQYGLRNAVAPLGTSFTEEHARLLSRFTRKVVVAFDGDTAGLAAAERTAGVFLGQGFQVNVVRLPEEHDPDSFLGEHGAEAFQELLRRSRSALEFLVRRAGERADLETPHGKAEALRDLLEFVVPISDVVERAEWIGRLAERLGLKAHLVEQAAAEMSARDRRGNSPTASSPERSPGWRAAIDAAPHSERELLRAVLERPDWLDELLEICGLDDLRDRRIRALLRAVRECRDEGVRVEATEVLARCREEGAGSLLSRLRVEDGEAPEREGARSCALGIRDDSLRRRLKEISTEIEDARAVGNAERLQELNAERLTLVRRLPEVAGTTAD